MSDTTLFQFRLPNSIKEGLQHMAEYKGLSVTSLVKMFVTTKYREEAKQIYTVNGLTPEEEADILQRGRELDEEHKNGTAKYYHSADELIKALHEER